MSDKTKIEWTNATWNPVIGCSKVSEGCLNCYAERMADRLAWMGNENYQNVIQGEESVFPGHWNGDIFCREKTLKQPFRWRKPRKIFVCSMGDLFHEKVPCEFLTKVMAVIEKNKQHIFQCLTKRPENMKHCFEDMPPPKNLWLGVTCENQKTADERIPILLQIPVAKRFVSFEPLLGEISFYKAGCGRFPSLPPQNLPNYAHHQHIDWFIIGCETGPRRRPCKLEWVKSLIDQAKSANIPVYVKQLEINGKISHNPEDWPRWAQRREWPEK